MTTVYERNCALLAEVLGAQILPVLVEPDVTEVMANADGSLWIERQGQPMQRGGTVPLADRLAIIRLAAALDGVTVTATSPSVDATLPGGERFHGSIPPRVKAPYFTIRTHQRHVLTRDDYVPALCPAPVFDRLVQAVVDGEMVLIAGMMSSGKSTLMTTLVGFIPSHERVVTVGDVQEVQVSVPNQVALVAPPHQQQDAIEEAWRSAAHRVLVEEIRSGVAALAALDVWMGLKGGLCTLHGKSARDALHRLEHKCGEVSKTGDFRPRIASVVDLVVYMAQHEGRRQVCEVVEVTGWNTHGYELHPLFTRGPGPAGAGE